MPSALLAVALAALVLTGCTTGSEAERDTAPRWTYENTRDTPAGPGLLSGEDGVLTIDDFR